MAFQVTNPNILGNLQAGMQMGQGIQDRRLQGRQREAQAGARDRYSRSTSILEMQGDAQMQGLQGMLANSTDEQERNTISQLIQMDAPTRTQNLRQIQLSSAQALGINQNQIGARGGMASAKTELYPNGTAVLALPNQEIEVRDPTNRVITDPQERIRVLKEAQESRIAAAGGKSSAIEGAKTVEISKREKSKAAIKLATEPEIAKLITQYKAKGATKEADFDQLKNLEANLPNLFTVVGNLRELGEISTYTMGGRAYDAVVRELGFEVPKGATARAKYVATIDNEVLPLLKQTFGAAFTFQEGQSLKATLGDANLSPAEKNAQLDAFIEQKVRQTQGIRNKLGMSDTGQVDGGVQATLGVDIGAMSDEELFK